MEEKKGVKELMEALAALEMIAKAGVAIAKDGKIGLDDLKHVIELVKKHEEILEGIKDADKIVEEVKDMDMVELQMVAGKVIAIVAGLRAA